MPTVSFVLLNYCSGDFVLDLIKSMAEQTNDDWDLIIVDNASPDNSLEKIICSIKNKKLKNYDLIQLDQNLHFAQGMNVGISKAKGDIIVPLNTDVYLDFRFVEILCSALKANKQERVGCFVGNEYIWNWEKKFLTGKIRNSGVTVLRRLSTASWNPNLDPPIKLLGPSGSASPFMREALEKVRLPNGDYYDRKFVSFGEDLDLLLRLRLSGYKPIYLPDLKFWHIGSASYGYGDLTFSSKPRHFLGQILSNKLRIWKKIPSLSEKIINLPIIFIIDIYYLFSILKRRGRREMIKVLRDYIRASVKIARENLESYPVSLNKINIYSGFFK